MPTKNNADKKVDDNADVNFFYFKDLEQCRQKT